MSDKQMNGYVTRSQALLWIGAAGATLVIALWALASLHLADPHTGDLTLETWHSEKNLIYDKITKIENQNERLDNLLFQHYREHTNTPLKEKSTLHYE